MRATGLRSFPPVTKVHGDASPAAINAYVDTHPDATAYHRAEWLAVISKSFGHRTKYLVAESHGRVVGLLPLVFRRSWLFGPCTTSMPFLNYGGVLADNPGAERALLDAAIDETRASGGDYLELRHRRQLFPDLAARRHKVAMTLTPAKTIGDQWHALDRKVRNQIRKAEKSDLTVEQGGTELVPAFYSVFARNMRDLGTPVYGAGFFTAVLESSPASSRVFVIRLAGRPVAAAIVHWNRATMEVPWASALREVNPLCANVLLYWHLIKFAIETGVRRVDLGRSTPGEGTFRFKEQWGALPSELVWEYWTKDGAPMPDLTPSNPKFAGAIRAWQRLPVSLTSSIGPRIARHLL